MDIKRVAIYLRVSTQEQNTDLQLVDLKNYVASKAWYITQVYEDKATGTNANRADLKRMLEDARLKKFDVIICWKLDRLFRSLKDLVYTLQELSDLEIEFVALKDNIDLTTSAGRLMTHILGAFAEFEASIIRSRVKAGLDQARRNGKKLGRTKTRPSELIRELYSKGYTFRQISKLANCSCSTVSRELNLKEFQK